jgi:hypothetical protein
MFLCVWRISIYLLGSIFMLEICYKKYQRKSDFDDYMPLMWYISNNYEVYTHDMKIYLTIYILRARLDFGVGYG